MPNSVIAIFCEHVAAFWKCYKAAMHLLRNTDRTSDIAIAIHFQWSFLSKFSVKADTVNYD